MLTKEILLQHDIETTTNPIEAIYILNDGTLVSGVYYDGERSEDHRILELISKYDRYDDFFWLDLFMNHALVMLEPETKTIYTAENQIISTTQLNIVTDLMTKGYEWKTFN